LPVKAVAVLFGANGQVKQLLCLCGDQKHMKRYYGYFDFSIIIQRILGSLFLLFSLFGFLIILVWIFSRPLDALALLPISCFSLFIGTFIINLFPGIELSEQGLTISVYLRKIRMPWSDIIDLRTVWFIGSNLRMVSCRKVMSFHWLYGLTYGGFPAHPGFLISSRIDGFDELIREIRARINPQ
jgi:hypothetical protein